MLDDDDIEAIARRVADLLQPRPAECGWVRVEVVCRRFGVSPTWVYANADSLGGVRLGTGPKARLRFDLDRCREAIEAMARPAPVAPMRKKTRPRRDAASDQMDLIRGRSGR